MNLYFEDHSAWLSNLTRKGIPHGDRIIKVFATESDPRIILNQPGLAVVQSESRPFAGEIFTYPGRQSYTGGEIETALGKFGLNDRGNQIVRALFRFSNRPDLRFCQTAMSLTTNGGWLIDHPLHDIDGLFQAAQSPETRTDQIHLDIFVAESLTNLDRLINFREEGRLVHWRDGLRIRSRDQGMLRGTERE